MADIDEFFNPVVREHFLQHPCIRPVVVKWWITRSNAPYGIMTTIFFKTLFLSLRWITHTLCYSLLPCSLQSPLQTVHEVLHTPMCLMPSGHKEWGAIRFLRRNQRSIVEQIESTSPGDRRNSSESTLWRVGKMQIKMCMFDSHL
jgi:hypothetical protein